MKRLNIPNFVCPIIGIIGLLNYIPIIFCPLFLNDIYFEYKQIIIVLCLLALILITLISIKRKLGFIVLSIYIIVLLFSKQIREFENKIVIEFNSGKDVSKFKTPILGYRLEIPNEKTNDIPFDALFKFNQIFGTYQALVFKKNHGLTMESFEGDYSLTKIYNKDWWLYKKGD